MPVRCGSRATAPQHSRTLQRVPTQRGREADFNAVAAWQSETAAACCDTLAGRQEGARQSESGAEVGVLLSHRYQGVVVGALAPITIWALHLLGFFQLPGGWLYDHLVRAPWMWQRPAAQVLLIETPARSDAIVSAEDRARLLGILDGLGAAEVVLVDGPITIPPLLAETPARARVLFARNLEFRPDAPERYRLEPWDVAGKAPPEFGVLFLPPAELGVQRHAAMSTQLQGETYPSISAAAAQRLGRDLSEARPTYLVNFNAGEHWLPVISLRRALAGELIPELVAGRTVLVGERGEPSQPGLHTPLTPNATTMSMLEFQGYAVDTLIAGREIYTLSAPVTLVLLVVVAVGSLFVYQWLLVWAGTWYTTAAMVAYLAFAWVLLHQFLVWLPVTEMATEQVLLFAWISRQKTVQTERALRRAVAEGSARLRDRMIPDGFYQLPEHWSQVITLVDQTLALTRLIFLERVEGQHRVREIKPLRCSLDDIDENRRDYQRTPYSTAIAEAGPIRLDHAFLRALDDVDEAQFLVPLLFGGEVQGFWAFGIEVHRLEAPEQFMQTVRDFGSQIAELLFHRKQWIRRETRETSFLSRYLQLEGGDTVYADVRQSLELFERRIRILESVFDALHVATVTYDLFGRVIHVNPRMENVMRSAEIRCFDLTALDLLTHISDLDRDQARQVLRSAVTERQATNLNISLSPTGGEEYVLTVRGITYENPTEVVGDEAAPFQLLGILFELVDITRLKRHYQFKDVLLEHFVYQIRSELQTLLEGTHREEETDLDLRRRARITELVHSKVESVIGTLQDVQSHLSRSIDVTALTAYPIDAKEPVKAAVKALEQDAARARVGFRLALPELMRLVMAEPLELREAVTRILRALLKDAARDSQIEIHLQEEEASIVYHFRNSGFGMPNERFQAYLFSDGEVAEGFLELREAIRRLRTWGGETQAASEVGVGTQLTVRLKAFL